MQINLIESNREDQDMIKKEEIMFEIFDRNHI